MWAIEMQKTPDFLGWDGLSRPISVQSLAFYGTKAALVPMTDFCWVHCVWRKMLYRYFNKRRRERYYGFINSPRNFSTLKYCCSILGNQAESTICSISFQYSFSAFWLTRARRLHSWISPSVLGIHAVQGSACHPCYLKPLEENPSQFRIINALMSTKLYFFCPIESSEIMDFLSKCIGIYNGLGLLLNCHLQTEACCVSSAMCCTFRQIALVH